MLLKSKIQTQREILLTFPSLRGTYLQSFSLFLWCHCQRSPWNHWSLISTERKWWKALSCCLRMHTNVKGCSPSFVLPAPYPPRPHSDNWGKFPWRHKWRQHFFHLSALVYCNHPTTHPRMFPSGYQIGCILGLTVIKSVLPLQTSPPLIELRVKVISFEKLNGVWRTAVRASLCGGTALLW